MLIDGQDGVRVTASPTGATLMIHGGRAYSSGNYEDSVDINQEYGTTEHSREPSPQGPRNPIKCNFQALRKAMPGWCGYRLKRARA